MSTHAAWSPSGPVCFSDNQIDCCLLRAFVHQAFEGETQKVGDPSRRLTTVNRDAESKISKGTNKI